MNPPGTGNSGPNTNVWTLPDDSSVKLKVAVHCWFMRNLPSKSVRWRKSRVTIAIVKASY